MRSITKWGLNIIQKSGLDGALIRVLKSKTVSPLVLKYCWDIRGYESYLEQYEYWSRILAEQNVSFKYKVVLEIGSGSSIGLGYFFLKDGVRKWTASDHFQAIDTRSTAREEKLVKDVANNFNPDVLHEVKFEHGLPVFGPRLGFLKLDATLFNKALEGQFDMILSTAVLEHIPKEKMQACIANMARYLRPGGIMIHEVDLRDHVNVSNPFNFYKYSEGEWADLTNDTIFYTNRLRSSDFMALFLQAGLKINFIKKEKQDLNVTIDVNPCFSRHDKEDLENTRIFAILEK